eukprot:6941757-Alexandrium_andersonii.AAC.2
MQVGIAKRCRVFRIKMLASAHIRFAIAFTAPVVFASMGGGALPVPSGPIRFSAGLDADQAPQ